MWRSPNGLVENEIDYILTNKKSIVKNEVVQRVNVGSDHQLVRGTIKTSTRIERCKMMRTRKSKVNIEVILLKKEEFQVQLPNRFEVLLKEGKGDAEEMDSTLQAPYRRVPQIQQGDTQKRRTKSLRVGQKIC